MKKSSNIIDMLQIRAQKTVSCPACGLTVLATKINRHLDLECISLNEADGVFVSNTDCGAATGEDCVDPKSQCAVNLVESFEDFKSADSNGITELNDFVKCFSTVSAKSAKTVKSSRKSESKPANNTKRQYSKRKTSKEVKVDNEDNDFVTKFNPKCSHAEHETKKLLGTIDVTLFAPEKITGSNQSLNNTKEYHIETAHTEIKAGITSPSESALKNSTTKSKSNSNTSDINAGPLDAYRGVTVDAVLASEPVFKDSIKKSESNNKPLEFTDTSPGSLDALKMIKSIKPKGNTSAPWRAGTSKRHYTKRKASRNANSDSEDDNSSDTKMPLKSNSTLHGDNIKASYSAITDSPYHDFSDSESTPGSQSASPYLPYYIANFKYVVNAVLNDKHNKHLFNSDDTKCIDKFCSLSDSSQKLYVRLFQRKYRWLRPSKINYSQIADDLSPYLTELVEYEFLETGSGNMELETALELLSLAESKSLSKHFNFSVLGKSKAEINQFLINHGKQHKSFFFCANGKSTVSNAMLKKVQQIMGPVYRLSLEPKRLFTRILMLFSLPTIAEDDEEAAGGQQQQLFTLLQVNKGEVTFPDYTITRECVIFENRDCLIRYEVARQLENDILNAIEAKKFEEGRKLYLQAENELLQLENSGICDKDMLLPPYLRRYTAGHVYTRCLIQGVEVLQKMREYEAAVELLRKLLNQTMYCQDRRGKWWERICLNLQQHLKQLDEAAKSVKEGLKDKNVRVGLRLALLSRAERIANTKKEDEELKQLVHELSSVVEAPKVTIHGCLLPRPIPGRRHIFISSHMGDSNSDSNVTILSVEQVAIEHYNNEGYSHGVHGEGSTFISLYTLLFWDILYDGSIPDAFISPYQNHPLDLNSDCFYERRQKQISAQLEIIRNSAIEDVIALLQCSWTLHCGVSSLVNWELFTEVEQLVGLISCLGNTILAGICERLAKDFRFTRSGVPDLVVWNPDVKIVKIVEVKGPGDKLSPKQILWLDYLLKLGADAEVCLVDAVGSKKLKK